MHAETVRKPLPAGELAALWRQLIADPTTPDYFELSAVGEILVSPRPANRHQVVITWAASQLRTQLGDWIIVEPSVLTGAGVLVPDLAWLPDLQTAVAETPLMVVPALVGEVLSPGNRKAEITGKIAAYLAAGAKEVLIIDLDGKVSYHRADGEHQSSSMGATLDPPRFIFD